jgi:hypothetical protein
MSAITVSADGVERIFKIGGVQVSDLVEWSIERFVETWGNIE